MRWVFNATPRPLYPAVKRHRAHFSTVGCLDLETCLEVYGKYRINWFLNPESSSAYRIAIPNTVPSHRYSTQLAINHRIPKLIPCFQKAEFWLYNFVPTFHKSLARVLPTLSLCHMHVYILNCHVSFMKWRKLKLSKLSVFKVNPKTQNKSCKSRLVTFIKKSFAFFATQIKESEGRSW